MCNLDTLIRTVGAYMRKEAPNQETEKSWETEKFGELILELHESKYGFLAKLADPDSDLDSIWSSAAILVNHIVYVADAAIRRRGMGGQ